MQVRARIHLPPLCRGSGTGIDTPSHSIGGESASGQTVYFDWLHGGIATRIVSSFFRWVDTGRTLLFYVYEVAVRRIRQCVDSLPHAGCNYKTHGTKSRIRRKTNTPTDRAHRQEKEDEPVAPPAVSTSTLLGAQQWSMVCHSLTTDTTDVPLQLHPSQLVRGLECL